MPLLKMYEVNCDCVIFQVMKMDVYFYVSMNGKSVCFICNKGITIQKEYNITKHYNSKLRYTNCVVHLRRYEVSL